MSINKFFEKTLGARVSNPRWSWGAVDHRNRIVFLRLWADQFETSATGQRVEIHWKRLALNSNGYAERTRHVELLRTGYKGIGVLCVATDPESKVRQISKFQDDVLYVLGEISEGNDCTYAPVKEAIPLTALPAFRNTNGQLAEDIKRIVADKTLDVTTKEALVNARVGQGTFRANVLRLWEHKCAVTGSRIMEAIRASHIKPWCKSTNAERLDPRNGIPLIASLDALFDDGLISFDESGQMLVSSRLDTQERGIYAVAGRKLIKPPHPETVKFLKYHRTTFFK